MQHGAQHQCADQQEHRKGDCHHGGADQIGARQPPAGGVAGAAELQGELSKAQEATVNAGKFMNIVRKYTSFEELTPTLYRLTHEGFVFSNYYQPGWGQSTTGGEFAVLTGLLPTWVGGDVSFWFQPDSFFL